MTGIEWNLINVQLIIQSCCDKKEVMLMYDDELWWDRNKKDRPKSVIINKTCCHGED